MNELKRRLLEPGGEPMWGLFSSLADSVAAEICAGAGFDVVVIDAEHGPNDLRTILGQLQAADGYPVETAVRCWNHDAADIKRLLDVGAQTLVVPMVDTAAQATDLVAATRYPPAGIRGVSSACAARWGRIADYHAGANEQTCLIAQIESAVGLENIEEICAVDGVDAVFIGPMDLASSLGHLAGGTLPEVVEIVAGAIERVVSTDTAAAVMATSPELVGRYTSAGARFVAVGVDTALLAVATSSLRRSLGNA